MVLLNFLQYSNFVKEGEVLLGSLSYLYRLSFLGWFHCSVVWNLEFFFFFGGGGLLSKVKQTGMRRKGPCRHCGIASTPLWRNGPARKPVLCNACGSRWRVKGSLARYIPLHAQAFNYVDIQGSKNTEEVRSDFSNFKIPKRMRGRPSTVEKLRRDLFRILQEQESLCPSRSPEEVLIFKREDPQSSDEIGLGCVLLKPPVPGEEPKSQSIQVSATEGSKDRLIGAIGQVKQLEENPAKWSDLKEKYLERIRLGNSNTLQSMHSLQMHKNMKKALEHKMRSLPTQLSFLNLESRCPLIDFQSLHVSPNLKFA
ncbi:GATA transcription factor 27-like isoform X2 [Macadamia integrifolia]|uniref:GATA transcription factor 27-like isoform X2 n=1 Tax=Macadamia integrifolia TaxID=60698 RepID=UPI001C4F9722|nr:GATA transcription factor 27-like isoform X2 [Macadamia integrifolia]